MLLLMMLYPNYSILVCRDIEWMRGVDSTRLSGVTVTLGHLALPPSIKRTGDILGDIEQEVMVLAKSLFQQGAFHGMKKGFKLNAFLSFILRWTNKSVRNRWPETDVAYPGYNSDNNLNDQRIELVKKMALLVGRNRFCIEGSHVSCMILYLSYYSYLI